MGSRIVHDQTGAAYGAAVEELWRQWEPCALPGRELLADIADGNGDPDAIELGLGRLQYRSHTTAEFASGIHPPPGATDAHGYLVGALEACRDTMGAIAEGVRSGYVEDGVTEIGVHALSVVQDAFSLARSCSLSPFPGQPLHGSGGDELHFGAPASPHRHAGHGRAASGPGVAVWAMVILCATLLTVLLFEIFLLSN